MLGPRLLRAFLTDPLLPERLLLAADMALAFAGDVRAQLERHDRHLAVHRRLLARHWKALNETSEDLADLRLRVEHIERRT